MEPPDFAHGRQARLLPADVLKHLKHHEAQKQEVEAEADTSHNDEGHLMVSSKGKGRLADDTNTSPQFCWQRHPRSPNGDKRVKPGILMPAIAIFGHKSTKEKVQKYKRECSKLLSEVSEKRNRALLNRNADSRAHQRPTGSDAAS